MEIIFAWRIDGLYFKPTQSLLLSISQCTMPSIHCLGLFLRLNFGINCRERFALLRIAMHSSKLVITTSMSVEQSTNACKKLIVVQRNIAACWIFITFHTLYAYCVFDDVTEKIWHLQFIFRKWSFAMFDQL